VTIEIRPIEPDDGPLVRAIYDEMSELSRRRRFLAPTAELSDEDLRYLTDLDHRRHEAVIAIDAESGRGVGVARYVRAPRDREAAEVAVVVVDDWHRRGIGTALLDRLTERARANGIARYTAIVSPDNEIVLGALDKAGAQRTGTTSDGEIEFSFDLPPEGLGDRLRAALRAAAGAPVGFVAQSLRRLPFWSGR
jgi:RimJ/RimL family protein N-acetyltransferase